MRCNRHVCDLSSSIGVCASCLRERLFVLIAAQVEENRRRGEERRKAEHQPPLVFPRSVSPYICRRSDDSSWHNNNDRRFYSTPQVGPTFSFGGSKKKHSSSKFSIFSALFRSSRSEVSVSDLSSSSDSRITPSTSSTSSPSWLANLLPSRRKKQSRFGLPPSVSHHRRKEKGMSPANVDQETDYEDGSPLESGYSSESYQGSRKSAATTATAPPIRRRGSTQHARNVSGLAFCLSPLVRASPNHRGQKDANLQPMGFSGEIARKPGKVHLSTAASLCANRSRKLADFGRYNNYNP